MRGIYIRRTLGAVWQTPLFLSSLRLPGGGPELFLCRVFAEPARKTKGSCLACYLSQRNSTSAFANPLAVMICSSPGMRSSMLSLHCAGWVA